MNVNDITTAARLRNARFMDDVANKILDREYYKFRYLPLEGKLPGLYFQQQTEDAINDIGNVAYATEEVADEALQIAQQAYNTALAALEIANNALAAAQAAQQTATTALNTANTALSTATAAGNAAAAAQSRADAAYTLAETANNAAAAAQQTADSAQTAADNALNAAAAAQSRADAAYTLAESLNFLTYYQNVENAADINTYVDVKRWYFQATNNTNAPDNGTGWLNVDNDYNDTMCKQFWLSAETGNIYSRFGNIIADSDPAAVETWSEWHKIATAADLSGIEAALTAQINTVSTNLAAHKEDYNNPHKVTAEQLGLATAYTYKGSVATYADLPTTGQKAGDVYNVETADPDHGISAGDNVAWDGEKWDILGGNHDLSAYATLAGNNVFTGNNTYTGNNTHSGTNEFGNTVTFNGEVVFANPGSADNSPLTRGDAASTYLPLAGGVLTGALTLAGTPTADLEAATKKYVDDAVQGGGGGGDVTLAGNNAFTGQNSFAAETVFDNAINVHGANTGNDGIIYLGYNAGEEIQANIKGGGTGGDGGRLTYTVPQDAFHTFRIGAIEALNITSRRSGSRNLTTITANAQSFLAADTQRGVTISGGGTGKLISFYPESSTSTAGMRLDNANEAISTDYSVLSLQNNADLTYTQNAALQVGGVNMLEVDNSNKNITIRTFAGSGASILFVPDSDTNNTSRFNGNGDFYISQGLTVGSTGKSSFSNGVIRAGNPENCLYFTGTAENTYFARPNTGNSISYQSSCNCYLIDTATNSPASFTVDMTSMVFHSTVGDTAFMQKTLTYTVAVGATVPVVTWNFPTGATVYYPSGTAPTLTANANNIINVIVFVDDTDSYIVQVCDTVAIPMA